MKAAGAGGCAHCGLRLPRRPARARIDGRTQWCCCYGCVLALAVTRAQGDHGVAAALLVRLGVAIFFTMNVMMVTMPTYAPAIYGGGADGPLFQLLRGLGVLLATPVLLLLGGPVLASAMGSWRSGLGVDALVVLGTVAAYGVSVTSVLRGGREVYVDTACMLLVLVTLGRYLEARAKADANAALRSTFAPESMVARRLAALEERVPAAELAAGDRIVVGPGERFPTDGLVEQGTGGVDESMLTGESAVQLKTPGVEVFGGTCSVDGRFVARVTRPLVESAAARIAVSLRNAMASRTEIERIADRAAAILGPLALGTAAAAGVWWGVADGPGRGVMVALAVLVVACPCALGIATPAAVSMALASAAERGIVVRSAPALERLARVTSLVFDKTGTLTSSVPRVAGFETLPGGGIATVDLVRLAAAVEADVPHPAARALLAHARRLGIQPATADAAAVLPGRGVSGEAEGQAVVIGTAALLAERGHAVHDPEGRWIWIEVDGRLAGRWRVEDTVDPAVPAVIRWLRSRGFRLALLTGAARADQFVPQLIAPGEAHCGLTPDGKVTLVRHLAQTARIAMVGDGLNDAPALAAADVGIAVGRASDLARLAADVVILRGGVGELPELVALARRTVRIARQNLGWAFGYNAIALALAAGACLTPVVAALAMLASSATVLANARRLRPHRPPSVRPDAGEPQLTAGSFAPAGS